jgi:hypothetical protein
MTRAQSPGRTSPGAGGFWARRAAVAALALSALFALSVARAAGEARAAPRVVVDIR